MALTTLILGAGLGKEIGFPDGPQLKDLITKELEEHEKDLRKVLEWSHGKTIDEIAVNFPNHTARIKQIVVKLLRSKENEATLRNNGATYKLMLNQISSALRQGDSVAIGTFNYDRGFQYLLNEVNSVESTERQIDPSIIHPIYGRLAPLWFEAKDQRRFAYHEFGPKLSRIAPFSPEFSRSQLSRVERQHQEQYALNELCNASPLFFIGESQKPLFDMKPLLEKSDQIFFLGLAYHSGNMSALGFDDKTLGQGKMVVGTGLGLTPEHIDYLKEEYPAVRCIERCDAFTFLQAKFDISRPSRNYSKIKNV